MCDHFVAHARKQDGAARVAVFPEEKSLQRRVTPPRLRFEFTLRVQPAEHQWFPSLTIVSIGTHSLHARA